MSQLSQLEPALCYLYQGTWFAWNILGERVVCGSGDFDMFIALLRNRGYYMLPPNSALAAEYREILREMLGPNE